MNPEYMLPDLWVQQVLADRQKRERAVSEISEDASPERQHHLSWWRRAFALVAFRPSSKRPYTPAVSEVTSVIASRG